MHQIKLNAAEWRTKDDFYDDLLSAPKAPGWHGRSLDALWDTVTERAKYDDLTDFINGVQPPFHVDVKNADLASAEVRDFLPRVEQLFALANAEHMVGISIEFHPRHGDQEAAFV